MKCFQEKNRRIALILLSLIPAVFGGLQKSHAVDGTFLFKIDGTVENTDGSRSRNGLGVVVKNASKPQRVQTDLTGNLAGDGKYVVTFFDPNAPVAQAGDIFEVSVIDEDGNLLSQSIELITQADIAAFGTSINVKLEPTPVGQIVANLFSINGTVYTAEGDAVEDGFSVTVQNTSKPSFAQTTTTGAVAGAGRYIITFFDPSNPVVEAGDVLAITVRDIAGNSFAEKEQILTEADVKAFSVTIDITPEASDKVLGKFESEHFTIDYKVTDVYRPDLTITVGEFTYPKYVVELALALEKAYATYKRNGFYKPDGSKDPIGDGKKMKVEIKPLTITEKGAELGRSIRLPNRIDIDNDMYPQDPLFPKDENTVFNVLRTTAAHELFHKVQDEYISLITDLSIDDFLKEGTAVWAEDIVYDDLNDYIRRINPTIAKRIASFLEDSDQPLFDSSYNSILFWKYLTEHYQKDGTESKVIVDLWEEIDPFDTNPQTLIEKVTGTNFETIFTDWMIANAAKELPNVDAKYQYHENQDGVGYGQLIVPADKQIRELPYLHNDSVNSRGTDYFVIDLNPPPPFKKPDLSPQSVLIIDFDGEESGLSSADDFIDVQVLMMNRAKGDFSRPPISLSLDSANKAVSKITVDTADKIVIIVGGADDGGDYTLSVKGEEEVLSSPSDVNADGIVNVFDLVQVTSQFGQSGAGLSADVNGDGVVNVFDLVIVSSHFGESTVGVAPSLHIEQDVSLPVPLASQIRHALAELEAIPRPSQGVEIAIQFLRVWLAGVEQTVTETKLLPNYPNPFNPETWIPYQLARDAEVQIVIYDINGSLVHRLDRGHQRAGNYHDLDKAVHWDGRNDAGEAVSSGVYFYQLRAGDFTAVKRMVIRK